MARPAEGRFQVADRARRGDLEAPGPWLSVNLQYGAVTANVGPRALGFLPSAADLDSDVFVASGCCNGGSSYAARIYQPPSHETGDGCWRRLHCLQPPSSELVPLANPAGSRARCKFLSGPGPGPFPPRCISLPVTRL